MGHPCSIQGGLARRLCIFLACTDPLSTLAPQTSIHGPGAIQFDFNAKHDNSNENLNVQVSFRGVGVG